MTLSRKAVRPAQTGHLLASGILPVSIDYRLCPEINLIEGAMADVRDSVGWARQMLPSVVASLKPGTILDTANIVVIGWSTGGHLALTTAWTLKQSGQAPPKAILCFYSPVDFFSRDLSPASTAPRITHKLTRQELMEIQLARDPMTQYETTANAESSELQWVKSGDPRSELMLSLFREPLEYGLSPMLNGSPGTAQKVGELVSALPSLERQKEICPTTQVTAGN